MPPKGHSNIKLPAFPRHKIFKRKKPTSITHTDNNPCIATANFQKKADSAKILRLFEQGTDIIFATEVNEKLTLAFVYGLAPNLAFRHINQGPHNGEKHGTAIFISPKLPPYATKQPHPDDEGLTCHAKLQIPSQPPIDLICVDAPPKDKLRRAKVEQVLSTFLHRNRHPINGSTITTAYDSTKPLLCGGDFNAILQDHTYKAKANGHGSLSKSSPPLPPNAP